MKENQYRMGKETQRFLLDDKDSLEDSLSGLIGIFYRNLQISSAKIKAPCCIVLHLEQLP